MEAVPRLPMISFPGRISVKPTEFSEHLKRYIRDHYHENPESYNNEIVELESLRRSAVNASTDFMGCSTLKKYYCQLHYLTSRFPLDETGIKLNFNWSSAFDQNHSESGDINLEMNSILYNISTLHTALGALDSRTTPDGMKISCTHFQCASWAFQVLSQSSRNDGEITSLLMTFMTNLSLSQAQECILEKSMTDNRKPNIIAKVAMQVVEYLRTTLKNLESFKKSSTNAVDLIGSKLVKAWQRHCEFKVSYYLSVTLFHQGLQSEEQQKMGERLSFYQGAVDKLDEASKLAKGLDKGKVIGETLTFANDVILGKLTAAQKENEFVYHEKVPPLESLPEVKGASLVKGIPFSFTDKEVAGQDIFARLVPLEAHQASSLYSEEKAKLLRRVTSEIHEKNEELDMYLASMQLDSLAFEENFDAIPQELVDSCADLNSRDAFKVLTEIMAKISNIYHDLQTKIKETELLIKEEDAKESEFCVISGTKRAPCQILTEARREAAKCREAHEAAGASNQALHNAITQHRQNIALLSKPLKTLLEALPSVAGVESDGDKATRLEVQRLLAKVREMQAQRSEFEGQLRMHLQEDDVTKELVTNQGDLEGFFEKQLSKHKSLVSLLEQNMSAQTNILTALSEANAAYGATRRALNQAQCQRSETVSSLLSSYNAFRSINSKAEDAKEFYSKLEAQVNKLTSRLKSFCKVQEEEREQRLAAKLKKFGGGSTGLGGPAFKDSGTSGPKLKDFLQAGIGPKEVQADMSGVDYGYRGVGGGVPPLHGMPDYRSQHPTRPAPLGSEKADARMPFNPTGQAVPPQFPPSAPSPAPSYPNPSSYPSTAYPNSSTSYPNNSYPSTTYPNTTFPSTTYSNTTYPSTTYPSTTYPSTSYPNTSYPNTSYPNTSYPNTSYPSTSYSNTSYPSTSYPSTSYPSNSYPSTAYPNTSSFYQPGMSYYQPGHPPAPSATGPYPAGTPSMASQTSTAAASCYSYPPYAYPSSSAAPGSNFSNASSSYSTSVSSNSSLNFGTQSTTSGGSSYQGLYSQGYNPQIPSVSSSSQYGQPSYAPGYSQPAPSQVPGQAIPPGAPPPPATQAHPATPPSNSSGNYVSQAGVYNTSLSSSTNGNGLPADPTGKVPLAPSTQVKTPPFQPPFTASSNYAPYSNAPATSNNAHLPGAYPGSTTAPVRTPYVNQSNANFSATSVQGQAIGGATYHQGQPQSGHSGAYGHPRNPAQGSSIPYPGNQIQSAGSSSLFAQGQSGAYNQGLPYGTTGGALPPKETPAQGAISSPYNPGTGSQYSVPVSSSSVPYNQYSYDQASAGQYHLAPGTQSSDSVPPAPAAPPTLPPTPNALPSTPNKPAPGGISNLDLLSGIDMTASAATLWSPLTPQTLENASTHVVSSVTSSGPSAPDVTASTVAAASEEGRPKQNGACSAPLDIISSSPLENVSALDSTPPVIDLAQLAKPKRLVSVLDPLTNDDTLTLLAQETERFSKLVLGLDKRSLNGPTNLEIKWNELVDTLETKCSNLKVSVGRCYPLKNRFPDNLSFDATRVPLPSARDDYINASYVQLTSVAESIPFIITQAPMPNTFTDFWTMVWENQVEIVVCLNSDAEVKGQVYLPRDAVEPFDCGNFTLHLKQIRPAANEAWIQRTLQLTHNTLKSTKVVLHIQFLTWPPSAMPESPGLFLQFINEVHNLQRQQRNKLKPVVAHCVSGTGRTGVFAVLSSFIKCIQNTGNLSDVWKLVIELSQQRRMSLQDRTHLLFLYSAALYYAQEVLMKRGILTDKATFEEGPREKTHVRHPSADLLSSDLNRMKAKLGFDEGPTGDTNLSRSGSQSSILSVGSSTGVSSHATPPPPSSVSPSPTHSAIGTKLGAADLPPNLAASLDPNCLVLNPPKPKKITRENFLAPSPARGLGHIDHNTNPSDPLSGLDPLWNLKKA